VSWVELFAAFVVCHLAGDFVLQTDWQATRKFGGLSGDRLARRALLSHVATYTLCFVPALIWIGEEQGFAVAIGGAGLIAVPHLIQDDGRLIRSYARRVKGLSGEPGGLLIAVDQSIHAITLFAIALLVGS
jgi:hypothetical protein